MQALSRLVIAAAAAAVLALPLPAAADDTKNGPGPDLTGRWSDTHKGNLTLDITRCGESWCGVIVAGDGACGFRALQMVISRPPANPGPAPTFTGYEGEFRYREGGELYKAIASIAPNAGPAALLMIHGNPATAPPYARMMLLHLQLARQGEARCRTDRPVS